MRRGGVLSFALVTALGSAARADDQETTVRVDVVANVPPYAIEAAACTLPDMRVMDRALDVSYAGHRCRETLPDADAIELRVRRHDAIVVLEATAPIGQEERVRAGVRVAADYLEARIAVATSPLRPTGPHRESGPLSSTLQQLGAGLAIVGALGGIASLVMFAVGNPDNHFFKTRDATFDTVALGTLGASAGVALLGGVMLVVGSVKVVRVTASASPIGGALRVVF